MEYIELSDKLHERRSPTVSKFFFHCPACECTHSFDVRKDGDRPNWSWNGDVNSPTFRPSLRYPSRGCHLHVTNGTIEFCGDCDHRFAGQTMDMVPL